MEEALETASEIERPIRRSGTHWWHGYGDVYLVLERVLALDCGLCSPTASENNLWGRLKCDLPVGVFSG